MILTVALLVVSNLLLADAWSTCCYPNELQMDVYETQTGIVRRRALDFTGHRFFESADLFDDEYVVIDFNLREKYTFTNDTCTKSPYPNVRHYDQCAHDDLLVPNYSPGLASGISGYGFYDGDVTRFLILNSLEDGHCVPLMVQDVIDGEATNTQLVHNVRTEIRGGALRIYSDTSKCV